MAAAVQAKTISDISDMIMSVELQRPRLTPVLPQWDLGMVLEALGNPFYVPLREASLKHLTLKIDVLLAKASAGRPSELQTLVFDLQYIQLKPKGAGVTLYFTPSSCKKIRGLTRSMTPVPPGKPDFDAQNCPVRAFSYYHRYMTELQELRKGRRHLFIPFKDNNAGKELSAASISVDMHHHSGFSCLSPE